jgi:hypothetical protein
MSSLSHATGYFSSLSLLGLPEDQVNRLYLSLFVHTVGYFEVVRSIVKGYMREDGNKGVYMTKIWRVFMILLEYACKTDY